MLKGLGFLDENGAPTERYFAFLDHSQSGRVLADALRDAYDELFALNKNAQKMTLDEVKGKLKSLTQGQKSKTWSIGWRIRSSHFLNWPIGLGPLLSLISYRRNSQRLQSFQLPRLRLLSGL